MSLPRCVHTHYRNSSISTTLMGLSLCMPLASSASEIATNILYSFHEISTFSEGIDTLLTLDAASVEARLLTNRLGTFSGGSMVFTINAMQSVSIGDPGVTTLPAEPRKFFSTTGEASISGGLLSAPVILNTGSTWSCTNTVLQCSSEETLGTIISSTPAMQMPTNAASLATPIRIQSSISSLTPIAPDYTLNISNLHLSGTWQVNAKFTAKTTTQYVADALTATTGTGLANRWAAASADIKALRNTSLTDVAVASNLQVGSNGALADAHRMLAFASDSATLLASGNATGIGFHSSSELTRQLWDVAASVDPSLGRERAGYGSESFSSTDITADLAVMQMILSHPDDTSFISGLDLALNNPVTIGSSPVFSFDGAQLGLAGVTMSVFYLGADNGEVTLDLGAASRYALWHSGYDFNSIAYIEGASEYLTASNSSNSVEITQGGGLQFVSESPSADNLLFVSGNGAALKLGLNNIYSNKVLVVASWAVTPVPEPAQAWLMTVGLSLLLWRRRVS